GMPSRMAAAAGIMPLSYRRFNNFRITKKSRKPQARRPAVHRLPESETRLIEFGRRAARDRAARGEGKPETFSFLGFTHICATSRSGRFWVRRKTDSKRVRAKLAGVKAEIRRRRYLPIPDQGRWLAAVVRGHQAYYAVPGNNDAVNAFRHQVTRHWHQALRRRSQKTRLTWARMDRIATRWLPQTRILHPFPEARFAAMHPR
ncbi:MAG TPA: hypothetical protein VMV92_35680, partial [Streptosporangiaceae bacterium]|nr:hypothetical protein [Streptosporangiaceae bacterium]HVB46521.1 hypothetical protein [Streptosporangiaceae bacterium]